MLFYIAIRVLDQVHLAEQPLVVERQTVTVSEGDQDPGVGRLFVCVSVVLEAAGHPEVQQQPWSFVQFNEQVLAVTPRGLELPTLEPALQSAGGNTAENLTVLHLDDFDVLVQEVESTYRLKTSSSGSSGTTTPPYAISQLLPYLRRGGPRCPDPRPYHGFSSSRSSVAGCIATPRVPMRVHRAAAHGIIKG